MLRAPRHTKTLGDPSACPCCGQPLPKTEAITIDPPTARLIVDGKSARLTPSEMVMVRALLRCSPGTLDYVDLRGFLYGNRANGGPSDNTLSVLLSYLRRKLVPLGLDLRRTRGIGVSRQPGTSFAEQERARKRRSEFAVQPRSRFDQRGRVL